MNQWTRIALGLGGNLGDRIGFLSRAYQHLTDDLVQSAVCSSVYETPAWGGIAKAPFLNAVVVGQTQWKPPAIVSFLKNLERELGRTAREHLGDREIDIDLLVFGGLVWSADGVTVPHPGIAERAFVLVPLVELWPDWTHPQLQVQVSDLLRRLRVSLSKSALPRAIDSGLLPPNKESP